MILVSSLRRFCVATVIVLGLSMSASTHAASYTNLVVFGDSLSDTGNIFDLFGGLAGPNPPYAEGRFTSNFTDGSAGLVWVDHLAALIGLPLDNSLSGGTNYAFGGARATDSGGVVPSLPNQLGFYLNDSGGVADSEALYVVFGGGNDVRDNDAADSAASIAQMITTLAAAGATNFLVPNLSDVGLTPESMAGEAPGGSAEVITAATLQFNSDLNMQLDVLEASLGVTITRFDLFSVFEEVIADPGSFGISNVTEACILTACLDPDSYLFFDGIHPTASVHQIMGELAYAQLTQVPVPAALPLFLSALGILGLRRRRAA